MILPILKNKRQNSILQFLWTGGGGGGVFSRLGTCQKLAGGEGGVGILNLGSEMR